MGHMEMKDRNDRHGEMPDLTKMLEMRSNKDAYKFYWMVFGPHVYGKDTFRKDVFAPYMDVEMSSKVFTENDEAWGLLVLEDNWEVWWDMAVQEYREYMCDRNVDIGSTSEEDTSTDTNGLPRSEEEDIMTVGGTMERRRIARRVVLTQLYSSKKTMGLSMQGFDRLEVLEDKVHQDRIQDGKVFFEYMKMSYIKDQGALKKMGENNTNQERPMRALRMM
jgi:hypothetical protein